ncbi:ribosome recycling factor [Buchnera aphidicola]|uniref:Ribosome-recycling factor n=1 Tax=Buchnera aphidicola (Therioaphis trifolii) TaxID=1241884 RepID=A0A4D6YM32_9GAMM|nr:ribosome recycling factor [Buchnera aphidicola]QCI27160.1 ribosome recycling factor [Buchnera aphidicola (Therioaphis trifolii)]
MEYDIIKNIKLRMEKCIEKFNININNIRVGRISTKLLDKIKIEYYGVKKKIKELSNITIENSNTLKITVFDKNIIREIEKKIFHSNLGVTPIVNNNFIKIIVPPITEERRKKIVKDIQIESEYTRINIRNIRRDANNFLKKSVKNKTINIDIEYNIQNEIQNLTNYYINKINSLLSKKELEIMKI